MERQTVGRESEIVKIIQNVRIRPEEAERLKEVAWKFSMKRGDFVKESEIIHFLITEFLDDLDFENGKLQRSKH